MNNLRELTKEEQEKAQKILSNFVYANSTDGETIKIADVDGNSFIGEVSISVLNRQTPIDKHQIKFT